MRKMRLRIDGRCGVVFVAARTEWAGAPWGSGDWGSGAEIGGVTVRLSRKTRPATGRISAILHPSNRDAHSERGSDVDLAVNGNRAPQESNDLLRDAEAQACTGPTARVRLIGLPKRVKNAG
jgi:hypothetical protein